MDNQKRVQWVYSSKTNEELSERYDQWAANYDQDLEEGFGYTAPQVATQYFTKYVPVAARVLDAGAGTGLVGQLLHRHGYRNLVAMDISAGMLAEARQKNVYTEFYQMTMGEPLNLPTAAFDAVICVGVLTVGHAPAAALDELVRIIRPKGHIVFTLHTELYWRDDFKEKLATLEADGLWKLVEVSDKFQPLPTGEPDVYLQVWVYKIEA